MLYSTGFWFNDTKYIHLNWAYIELLNMVHLWLLLHICLFIWSYVSHFNMFSILFGNLIAGKENINGFFNDSWYEDRNLEFDFDTWLVLPSLKDWIQRSRLLFSSYDCLEKISWKYRCMKTRIIEEDRVVGFNFWKMAALNKNFKQSLKIISSYHKQFIAMSVLFLALQSEYKRQMLIS